MRRILRTSVIAAAVGAAVAISALLLGVDRRDHLLDAYLVYLAALVAVAVARLATGAFPAPRKVAPSMLARRPERRLPPAALAHTEDVVALAQADALDLHFRLRPLLAEVAAAGYAPTGGGRREELPAAAEGSFSPETWALVRPDRPRPEGAGERGIATEGLRALLDELESILPP